MMRRSHFLLLSALGAATLLPCFWAPQAMAIESDRRKNPTKDLVGLEMAPLAQMPLGTPSLNIDLLNCDFLLVHEKRSDIEVRANYPGHWHCESTGLVRQTQVARCYPGFYHTSNGNNLLGMGTVPAPLPAERFCINITGEGIYMGGKKMPVERKLSRPDSVGFDMNERGMFLDGHRLKPMNIKGSDLEVDTVKILLPEDFQGCLHLTWKGSLPAKMDFWSGGNCQLLISGRGEFDIGKINSEADFVVDSGGRLRIHEFKPAGNGCRIKSRNCGQLTLDKVECSSIDMESSGAARIDLRQGDIGTLKAVAAGGSRIHLGVGQADGKPALSLGRSELKLGDKSEAMVVSCRVSSLKIESKPGTRALISGLIDQFQTEGKECGSIEVLRERQGPGQD